MDSASLLNRMRAIPRAKRIFRRVAGFEEGSVVEIARGPAAGLRWARHHRYLNGYWLGVYELPLQHLLARELRPGDCFWDVGANAGFFSVLAAKLVGHTGHVRAFEPLPANVESIRRQFELNPLCDCEVVPAAVSDQVGTATLVLTDNTSTPHLGSAGKAARDRGSGLTVDTVTLDSVPGPRPTLVKVDVEGAELAVLEGAADVLDAGAKWLIELHDDPVRDQVHALLEDAGYSMSRPRGLGRNHAFAVPLRAPNAGSLRPR
jgi:FkbM family methyltransferase